jgi:hypothetical protein
VVFCAVALPLLARGLAWSAAMVARHW